MKLSSRKIVLSMALALLIVSLVGLWLIRIELLVIRGRSAPDGEECTHLYVLSLNPLLGIREVSCLSLALPSRQAPLGLAVHFKELSVRQGRQAACLGLKTAVGEVLERTLDYYLYLDATRMSMSAEELGGIALDVARDQPLHNREGEIIGQLSAGVDTPLAGQLLRAYLSAQGEDGLEVVRRDINYLEKMRGKLLANFFRSPRRTWRAMVVMTYCLAGELRWWEFFALRDVFSLRSLSRAGWRPVGATAVSAQAVSRVKENLVVATKTPQPLTSVLKGLRVIVLNGCGKKGVARGFSAGLERLGLEVIDVDNADNWQYPACVLIDMGPAPEKCAELGRRLGLTGKKLVRDIEESGNAEATIIIGADYESVLTKLEE